MNRVYIANFGEGNALWPTALANNTVLTIDNVEVHDLWRARDRDGWIETALQQMTTARGQRPSRQTAGRWYNVLSELVETEGDLWITRQADSVWWTMSQPGEVTETLIPALNPMRDGASIWLMEKPCLPWSNRDRQGRRLLWDALHAKARDFLSTEATFQTIANDRGYADYARALINGESLAPWESLPLFKEKAASAKKQGVRIYSPKELAAADMARTILNTVAQANGQTAERTVKEKLTTLSGPELEEFLRLKIDEQEGRCALTGLPLGFPSECEDKQMLASADRIDSSGHYTPDNIQVVCRFINRWKGGDDNDLALRLIGVLKAAE